ncbi:MAG: Por secretion system protein [Prevotella sp.]|nr:Por secretion system protein [Prevotella sp.]
MKRILLFALFFISCICMVQAEQTGKWKAYLSYSDVQDVDQGSGNIIYVLASNNIYSYNAADQSIQTFDKTNGLSDCNISHISYNKSAKRLVIIYSNQNIDLMDDNGNVVNISDYYNSSITSDKTINDVCQSAGSAYLSTGFGIVKLNVANAEISDTYNLGFKVDYSYLDSEYIYAASSVNGIYRALTTSNLLDKNNWKRVADYATKPVDNNASLVEKVSKANPGGPKYNYFGFMKFYKGNLYTCGGGWNPDKDLMRPGCVQVLKGDEWSVFQDNLQSITGHSYVNLVSMDVDPNDDSHVFASGRIGLYEFKDGKFVKEYNYNNSPLQGAATVKNISKDYVLVQGLCFDERSNLWLFNSNSATTSLLELTSDGKWNSFHKDVLMNDGRSFDNMTNPFFDSRKLLWFVDNYWGYPALVSYNMTTDKANVIHNFVNQDNSKLLLYYVRCAAEDKENNIWIGTSVGPLMLEASNVTESNPIFQQIKVPRNDGTNYADYLLSGVDITCMAVDGGNRKWFGTNGNGVYLVSSNNIEEIHHFTEENSKLLSNNVESIAINGTTGEVFFGTDKGLCSFISDANDAQNEMTKQSVYAYPNPVRPDYTGVITVTGLSYNADVKIVTSAGTLVAEGRSNGGMFTWDGKDKSGRRVASGIYMVETATQDGDKGVVCKIAMVK